VFQLDERASAETVLAVHRSRGPGSEVRHRAYEEDFPLQAFQAEEPIRYDAPPFRVGHKFAQALTKAIKKVGVKKVEKSNYAPPPRALLDALAQLKV
jgi:hypothetical protein